MTQQSSSNNTPEIKYFNLHKEGLGYLDSLVEVKPKPGQDFAAFWTGTVCLLEGHPQNPDKLYYDITVPGADVIALLTPYLKEINDQSIKVFGDLRLAKDRAKPFMYGPNSNTPGKLGVNYSARLIKVLSLKVGDKIIKLKDDDEKMSADGGTIIGNNNPVQHGTSDLFIVPLTVKLSKDDENFLFEKDRLKKLGYGWHSEKKLWIKCEILVKQDDVYYVEKIQLLESIGYRFYLVEYELGEVWRMELPKPKANNAYSKVNQQRVSQHLSV